MHLVNLVKLLTFFCCNFMLFWFIAYLDEACKIPVCLIYLTGYVKTELHV